MSRLIQLEPFDEQNEKLESHVRPPNWRNPKPDGRYNLVVIGAGTAGLVTAAVAAGLGAKVALIERQLMGGDCLNVGCVPSKALIRAARSVAQFRRAGDFGVQVSDGVSVDFESVMRRMRTLRAEISQHDSVARFSNLGVEVFLGNGRFVDSETIDVDGTCLKFSRAVIATGARASAPAIPGLDQVSYLTNESIFSLTSLPERLGVVGAGPIGCELAQVFALLGSHVCLLESGQGILSREDRDAASIVEQRMKSDGVSLLCSARNLQVTGAEGGIRLDVEAGGESHAQQVDQLLVAAGRAPNVEGLDLEKVGVQYDVRQGVHVDDRLRTTNKRIFAAGDICSAFKFTHAADFMARTVIRNALLPGRAKMSSLVIPWCTYTSPELAHVGLLPADQTEVDTYLQPMAQVDRAVLDGEQEGFVKIHTAKGTDRIVGATIVAQNAGDLIGEVSLAMTQGIPLRKLASVIHPYPTQAEAIRKVGDLYNRSRLTPFVQKMLRRWFKWNR